MSELERQLHAAKDNAVLQAQIWAQEARTQRATVLSILRYFGLPENDWEALWLIQQRYGETPPAGVKVAGEPCRYPNCSCPNRESDGLPHCRAAAAALGVAMGDCGNAECNWRGPLSECSYVGAVGPCCPECREIVEPDAAGVPAAALAEPRRLVVKTGTSPAVARKLEQHRNALLKQLADLEDDCFEPAPDGVPPTREAQLAATFVRACEGPRPPGVVASGHHTFPPSPTDAPMTPEKT